MKIICVGRNYADHAKELNNEVPTEPVLFMKPQSALVLPGKPIYYPEFTDDFQYECEVVLRISKNGKFIQEKFAHKYFSEITVGLDLTARDVQQQLKKKGLPWELAKAFDGSAVLGSYVPVTEDVNVQQLDFRLDINGETVQQANTREMIFPISKIIAYASQYFTLNIGDLIYTGTPAGVGQINIQDEICGYLNGEKLLDITVR
ncbi:MAG: FAA hydrolase family protein [Chitinophagia bacterium]|nr:FAA hydrolase family protein [Chitinophagia bacterium]